MTRRGCHLWSTFKTLAFVLNIRAPLTTTELATAPLLHPTPEKASISSGFSLNLQQVKCDKCLCHKLSNYKLDNCTPVQWLECKCSVRHQSRLLSTWVSLWSFATSEISLNGKHVLILLGWIHFCLLSPQVSVWSDNVWRPQCDKCVDIKEKAGIHRCRHGKEDDRVKAFATKDTNNETIGVSFGVRIELY